jgi:predicted peptidase
VQQRKYHFADTNEDLPYALFVSSRVTKSTKAPLIVALHGVFGNGNSLLRGSTLDLAELSEKDVMNVLAIVRKEFTVDNKRTYLMGHSMGGAGALFLGPKYVDQWAAVASMAPAAFRHAA